MRRRAGFTFAVALLLALAGARGLCAVEGEEDTDVRLVDARVVEVNHVHISVVARTGVEHVIGIDHGSTKVKRAGRDVTCSELRTDDLVTVELDEAKQVKFAKQIEITRPAGDQVARTPR
jgi:hypothetical protein